MIDEFYHRLDRASFQKGGHFFEPDGIIEFINYTYPLFKGMCYYDHESKRLLSRNNRCVDFYFDRIHQVLHIRYKEEIT